MKVLIQQTEAQYLTITKEIEMTEKQYKEFLKKGDYFYDIEHQLSSDTAISEFNVNIDGIDIVETNIIQINGQEKFIKLQ